jgi:hypothetical protein
MESSLQRKNDIMLLQFFIELKFSPNQLETLNHCRIYLQVVTLSDITSADGTTLLHPVLQGEKLTDRKSTLHGQHNNAPNCQLGIYGHQHWNIYRTMALYAPP